MSAEMILADELERLKHVADSTSDGDPYGGSDTQDALDMHVEENWTTIIAALRRPALEWRPIDTAPVPPYKPDTYNASWRCLLQSDRGDVGEGWAYWVPPRKGSTKGSLLRWANKNGQCFPKYWMPLPAPKVE